MIRPIQMSSSTVAISVLDAALDLEKADSAKLPEEVDPVDPEKKTPGMSRFERYLLDRQRDPSSFRKLELPVKDGTRLTVFEIGVIPAAELNRIEDECGVGRPSPKVRELHWRCFLASVRDIADGWGGDDAIPKVKVGGVSYVDPTWLSRMFVGSLRKVALDIGAQAWSWNQVLGDEIKN